MLFRSLTFLLHAFLMDEERSCCAELAAILERQPELASRVFEHCWEDWLGNDYDSAITESVMMSAEDWLARRKRHDYRG